MNREQIIRMAREAGFWLDDVADCLYLASGRDIERFAALAAAAEREACAKEFDRRNNGIGFYDPHEPAEIIRAMGKQ